MIKVLIDQRAIEHKVLVETLKEAKEIVYRQRVPNVTDCYLPDGGRLFRR